MVSSFSLHPIRNYWIEASHPLGKERQEGEDLRIAVTSGGHQNADTWFMYPFLGPDFGHTLLYVPISQDGHHIAYGPDQPRMKRGRCSAWVRGLLEEDASHVMSFWPRSVELDWMQRNPAAFTLLAGNDLDWGLFRIEGEALAQLSVDAGRACE
jgi:hypothetical protein